MTGRIAAMSMDGTPVSEADAARIHAEEEMHAQWRRRTVRVVASAAHDVSDCRLLISILGLDEDIQAARAEHARPAKAGPGTAGSGTGTRRPRRSTHAAA
ncbi:MAG: hypothetical protein ACRDWT_00850 [Jatrophihabitantaceae bacterium]